MRYGILALALTSMLVPARAHGGDLYSAAMFVPTDVTVRCSISNVGTSTLKENRMELVRADGTTEGATSGAALSPGASASISSHAGYDRTLRCHWSFRGSAKKVRAAICTDLQGCLPAS